MSGSPALTSSSCACSVVAFTALMVHTVWWSGRRPSMRSIASNMDASSSGSVSRSGAQSYGRITRSSHTGRPSADLTRRTKSMSAPSASPKNSSSSGLPGVIWRSITRAPGRAPISWHMRVNVLMSRVRDSCRLMWRAPTNVPRPCIFTRKPSEHRSSIARRTVMRLTP